MRIAWVAWVLLVSSCISAEPETAIPGFNNTIVGGDPGQTIAFVGEKIALEESDYACPQDSICLDARYHARYRIVELLEGQFDGEVIDFVVYDHYGYPRFAGDDPVVLYVLQIGGKLYHHKYSYDPLYPVRGGGHATCGDPFVEYAPERVQEFGRKELAPFAFEPPVTRRLSSRLYQQEDLGEMSQDDIRENFVETMRAFAPPAFAIDGDIATCKMGMSAKKVAAVRMRYEFIPSRLHSERHARCWKDAGLPSGSATVREMYESGYDACMKSGE